MHIALTLHHYREIIYPYRWCCCRWTWSWELCLWGYVCQLYRNFVSFNALFLTCIGLTTCKHNSSFASTVAFLLAVIKLALELFKLRHSLDYLRHWNKRMETLLYVFSIIFVAVGPHFDHRIWQLGVLAIFQGWIVLIGYLQAVALYWSLCSYASTHHKILFESFILGFAAGGCICTDFLHAVFST